MKRVIGYVLLLAVLPLLSCANYMEAAGANDIGDPPFPPTPSIMPLLEGNTWNCSYTEYDSLGNKIVPNRADLRIAITAQYGMVNDTALERITTGNYWDTSRFEAQVYQYNTAEQAKSYLVTYRRTYPLEKRGLYVIGEYEANVIRLYPVEQLWLAYPADSGRQWQYKPDPLGDSSRTLSMQIVSTNATATMIDYPGMAGIRAVDSCYLYRQSNAGGDSVSYYYYNEKIGGIAYERYIKGKLRVTYILKSFTNKYRKY